MKLNISFEECFLLYRALNRLIYIGNTEGWKGQQSEQNPTWMDDWSLEEKAQLEKLREKFRTRRTV